MLVITKQSQQFHDDLQALHHRARAIVGGKDTVFNTELITVSALLQQRAWPPPSSSRALFRARAGPGEGGVPAPGRRAGRRSRCAPPACGPCAPCSRPPPAACPRRPCARRTPARGGPSRPAVGGRGGRGGAAGGGAAAELSLFLLSTECASRKTVAVIYIDGLCTRPFFRGAFCTSVDNTKVATYHLISQEHQDEEERNAKLQTRQNGCGKCRPQSRPQEVRRQNSVQPKKGGGRSPGGGGGPRQGFD